MIRLHKTPIKLVEMQLRKNGTRDSLIKNVLNIIGDDSVEYGMDIDKRFTIVRIGSRYGVAKRCTYAGMNDYNKEQTGFTIALLRALDLKK